MACGGIAFALESDESGETNLGISFRSDFFDADFNSQREVITHEYFHFVCGLVHYYGTTSTQGTTSVSWCSTSR